MAPRMIGWGLNSCSLMMRSQWLSSFSQAVSGAGASATRAAGVPCQSKVAMAARISYIFRAISGCTAVKGGAMMTRVADSQPRMRSMMKKGPPRMLASGSSQRMRGTGTFEPQKVE